MERREKLKVSCIPAGSMGMAMGLVAYRNGHEVIFYFHDQGRLDWFRNTHTSERLPGIQFSSEINATGNLQKATEEADVILLVPPAKYMRPYAIGMRPFLKRETLVISGAKGLDPQADALMSQVLEATIPGISNQLAVMSGPNFAIEIAQGLPAATDLAFVGDYNTETKTRLLRVLCGNNFIPNLKNDPIGIQVGGVGKNMVALAAGACTGLGLGENARAALITRGIEETERFALALGGKESTFRTNSMILADFWLTCTSTLSRNYMAGYEIAQGSTVDQILATGRTVEGFGIVDVFNKIRIKLGIEAPLTKIVHLALNHNLPVQEAANRFISRAINEILRAHLNDSPSSRNLVHLTS